MRIKIARLAAAAMWLLAGAQALAEDVSPQDEYEKRLKLARTIQPLGEAPFGENYRDHILGGFPGCTWSLCLSSAGYLAARTRKVSSKKLYIDLREQCDLLRRSDSTTRVLARKRLRGGKRALDLCRSTTII